MSDEKERQAITKARNDVVEYHGNRFDTAVGRVLDLCESPIERLFAIALVGDVGHSWFWEDMQFFGRTFSSTAEWGEALRGVDRFACFQQAGIGKHRADFLIAARRPGCSGNTPGDFNLYVVECDGHDFHERTKEQAARDRSRDRSMSMRGYKVVRFTGSEIYRNSAACVEELQAIVGGFEPEDDA